MVPSHFHEIYLDNKMSVNDRKLRTGVCEKWLTCWDPVEADDEQSFRSNADGNQKIWQRSNTSRRLIQGRILTNLLSVSYESGEPSGPSIQFWAFLSIALIRNQRQVVYFLSCLITTITQTLTFIKYLSTANGINRQKYSDLMQVINTF